MNETKGGAVDKLDEWEKFSRAWDEATPETRRAVIDILEKAGYLSEADAVTS